MHAIGIDMSKDSFHAAINEKDVQQFRNSRDGVSSFIDLLNKEFSMRRTTIGVEATGVYHLLFAMMLTKHEWKVVVINPLESHKMITQGLRTVKTDRLDAQKIRDMVRLGKGYPFTDTEEILALKALVVERQGLVEMRKMTKQRMQVNQLKSEALNIPLHDSQSPLLKALSKEIKVIERCMGAYEQELQLLLRSIPGIGCTTSAALVAFIGDIHRFSAPEKLVAYIGLDSRVYESGTSIKGKGFISKRGNIYLRHMLFNAAFIARQYNPDLKNYYEKKIREGKHYFTAMCAIERKLVHLIYAVWKRGTPYDMRRSK